MIVLVYLLVLFIGFRIGQSHEYFQEQRRKMKADMEADDEAST